MRVVFMGTPAIAATVLRALSEAHEVVGAFTRPDAISGRGNKTLPSPVKTAATELGIPVVEASSLRSDETFAELQGFNPDVICVVAYGAILPARVLDFPKFGCLNVHASLLPRWRGAAPIERALLAGDVETGVSIMRMDEGLDTGGYLVQRKVSTEGKNQQQLTDELAQQGASALLETLALIEESTDAGAASLEWTQQLSEGVTYAQKIGKGELDFDLASSAVILERKVRASSDAHASHATLDGKRVIVLDAQAVSDPQALGATANLSAGQAVFRAKRLLLKASNGVLEVLSLRPEGKKNMDAKAFCAGIQGVKQKIMTWESAR